VLKKPQVTPGELFSDFNERFFSGRLPTYSVEVMPSGWEVDTETIGEHDGFSLTVRLSESLLADDEALREVLIHEMAHAAVFEISGAGEAAHGTAFLTELLRLLRAGAPVNPLEFDQYGGDGFTEADLIRRSQVAQEAVDTLVQRFSSQFAPVAIDIVDHLAAEIHALGCKPTPYLTPSGYWLCFQIGVKRPDEKGKPFVQLVTPHKRRSKNDHVRVFVTKPRPGQNYDDPTGLLRHNAGTPQPHFCVFQVDEVPRALHIIRQSALIKIFR
jgi:hypothetical protein